MSVQAPRGGLLWIGGGAAARAPLLACLFAGVPCKGSDDWKSPSPEGRLPTTATRTTSSSESSFEVVLEPMGGGRALLAASVISVQNSCFTYPACQNCCSRLSLDSRRFNCLKCGCTGKVKDARYRYRLSLKVADTNDLFDITVFGSCLDPFFGVTAENLQRYIEDLNQLSGGTNKDASPEVLVRAVETCFIGKRFIFGVKGYMSQDGGRSVASSILQNCSRINRGTKSLTACQIFLPNAAVTGFTVISCFRRLLQSTQPQSCNSSSCFPDVSWAAVDQPGSELSSFSSLSRNSWSVQHSLLGCWQQSLSLTSSVAWVTADSPCLEKEKSGSEQSEQEERPLSAEPDTLSLDNQTLWDSEFCSSSVKKRNKEEEDELSSQSNQTNNVSAPDRLERISSSKTACSFDNSSQLLQNFLELEVKNTYLENNSGNGSYAKKSHNSLSYKSQVSPSNHANAAGVTLTDSMFWDELPFSESLNEFLARMEDDRSAVTSPNLDTGKHARVESSTLDVNVPKSSRRQSLVADSLHGVSALGELLSPVERERWESSPITCFQPNPAPQGDEESPCESVCSVFSLTTKEQRERCGTSFFATSSPHQLIPSQSTPVATEPSPSTSRFVQLKEVSVGISKPACSFMSPQAAAEHRRTPYLQSSEAARVHSTWGSCSFHWENKENYSSTPGQNPGLACSGAWRSDAVTPSTIRRTCKTELKPPRISALQRSISRSIHKREVLGSSGCPESSYNLSADLFEANTRELAKTKEFLNKSWKSVSQEDALTQKGPAELVLNPVDVPCNTSKCRWSPGRSPPAFSQHSTPLAFSFCDLEASSVSSQGFIPYSQSTPVAKPFPKIHPVGERSSCVTMFTPKNLPKMHSKHSRLSFQNTLLQQLTGRAAKRRRPSKREGKVGDSSGSPQSLGSDGFEEWIPPSAAKRLKPAASLNCKAGDLAAGLQPFVGRSPAPASKFSRQSAGFRRENLSLGSTGRIPATPRSAGIAKALFLNETVLESRPASEGKNRLSCANYSRGTWGGTTGWSPELFFQARTQNTKK